MMQRCQTGHTGLQSHNPILPLRCTSQKRSRVVQQGVPIPEIASIASSVQTLVETITSAAPEPLQPAVQVIGGDIASVAALSPTMPGLMRLTVRDTPDRHSSSSSIQTHTTLCHHTTASVVKCTPLVKTTTTTILLRAVEKCLVLLICSGALLSVGHNTQPHSGCAGLLRGCTPGQTV